VHAGVHGGLFGRQPTVGLRSLKAISNPLRELFELPIGEDDLDYAVGLSTAASPRLRRCEVFHGAVGRATTGVLAVRDV
jgi:hypothetical protein